MDRLTNPPPELTHDPDVHGSYRWAGRQLASVTRVLSLAGLTPWGDPTGRASEADLPDAVLRAGERGDLAHRAIKAAVETGDDGVVPGGRGYARSALDWLSCYPHTEVEAVETPVAHPILGYGGVVDLVMIFGMPPRERIIVDWKTSASIYPSHHDQLAAYARAFDWTYRMGVPRAFVVRPMEDGGPARSHEVDVERHWRIFAAALTTVLERAERGLIEVPW